jgi:hypothetical protein
MELLLFELVLSEAGIIFFANGVGNTAINRTRD